MGNCSMARIAFCIGVLVAGVTGAEAPPCEATQVSIHELLETEQPKTQSLDELTVLYSKMRQASPREQKDLIPLESPEAISYLWRMHFLETMEVHELNEDQCMLLGKIARVLSPQAYSEESARAEARSEAAELMLLAGAVYPEDLYREFFVHMGSKHVPGENLDKICQALTDEELRSMFCAPKESPKD